MSDFDISTFYKQQWHSLTMYAYQVFGNMSDAEDAVQDTMIVLLEKSSTLDKIEDMSAWSFGILKKIILSKLRKRGKDKTILQNCTILQKPYHSLVADISTIYRTRQPDDSGLHLLILFYCYGYSIDDLCQLLDIKESACKMRIFRQRKYLQQLLND